MIEEDFLHKYNPSAKLPVPIEEIVELKIGIAVVVVPGIKKLLGIDAFINSDFSQITIDEYAYTAYPERTKFSIDHEIYKYLEIQASTFAGLILVPKEILLEKLKSKLGKVPVKESLELLLPIFQDLLDIFQVSGEVLLRRMQKEGFVKSV